METQRHLNYARVARAIEFIRNNFRDQPALDDVAGHINLSPAHFQRLFTEWAGTSPKRFLQFISVEHAKRILEQRRTTVADAAFETGLSSSSRLHDLFISIEGMTPAEYRHGGRSLQINYRFADTAFGPVMVASTAKGICHLAFHGDESEAITELKSRFPEAAFSQRADPLQEQALLIFQHDRSPLDRVKLHLKGTEFQLKVWESLLKIPMGGLSTYGRLAGDIGSPSASRAVGTAIGSNPVAYLIPCHRVIQSSGAIGGYMWGPTRKTAILGWEAAKIGDTYP